MIFFSYFFSSHSSMVPVSEENTAFIRFHGHQNSLMQSLIKILVVLHYLDFVFILNIINE